MDVPEVVLASIAILCASMVAVVWLSAHYDPKKRVCELCGARLVPFTATPQSRRQATTEAGAEVVSTAMSPPRVFCECEPPPPDVIDPHDGSPLICGQCRKPLVPKPNLPDPGIPERLSSPPPSRRFQDGV